MTAPGSRTGGTSPALPNHRHKQSAKANQLGGKPLGDPAIARRQIFVRTDSPDSAHAPPTSPLMPIPLFTLASLSASPRTSDFSLQKSNG